MKNLVLNIFVAIIFVAACSKKEESKPVDTGIPDYNYANCKVTKLENGSDSIVITYLGDGKMLKYQDFNGIATDEQVEFTYNTNQVNEKYTYASGTYNLQHFFKANGQFNQTLGTFAPTSGGSWNVNVQYVYNADNLLYDATYTYTSGANTYIERDRFFYNNGNIDKKVTYVSGGDSIVNTYTYHENPNAFSNVERGMFINGNYGFANKNLLKRRITVAKSGTSIVNYTYDFDKDGRVTTKTISGTPDRKYTISYSCN